MEYYAVVVISFCQLCKVPAGLSRAIVELENNVRDESDRKAATNIPLLLEYGTTLPESPKYHYRVFSLKLLLDVATFHIIIAL
jgi:hypothetical protein